MVGGEPEPVKRLEPIFRSLAPQDGYLHAGGPGAGHYVKMVHNGIEYGLMQAYAEGFEILHASDYKLDLAASPTCGCTARLFDRGSSSWAVSAFSQDQDLAHLKGWVADSGEGPLDRPGGHRQGRSGASESR